LRQEWIFFISLRMIMMLITTASLLLGEACKNKNLLKPYHRPTHTRRAIYFIRCVILTIDQNFIQSNGR
jgi:hypothetical protein